MTDAVAPISAQLVVDHAAQRPPALDGAIDRFNKLMQEQPHETSAARDPVPHGGTAMSHFVSAQESVMRQTYEDVRTFSAQAPSMDVHAMASRQIALSYQIAMVQVQFNAGVYVAQSSKNGLQTLMKNQ